MKKMTVLVLGALAALLFVDVASAQPWRTSQEDRRGRHDNEVAAYIEALELDEGTAERFRAIMDTAFVNREDVFKAAFDAGPGNREGVRKEMQSIDAEVDAALAEVLNSEQLEEYTSIRAERRESMRSEARSERRGRRGGRPGQ